MVLKKESLLPLLLLFIVLAFSLVALSGVKSVRLSAPEHPSPAIKLLPENWLDRNALKAFNEAFGNKDLLMISLTSKEDQVFNREFLLQLQIFVDQLMTLKNIDRRSVLSLLTPGITYQRRIGNEIEQGEVIPADLVLLTGDITKIAELSRYSPTARRLLSANNKSTLVLARVRESSLTDGSFWKEAEQALQRLVFQLETHGIAVEIIGAPRMVGEVRGAVVAAIPKRLLALICSIVLAIWLLPRSSPWLSLLYAAAVFFLVIIWLQQLGIRLDPFTAVFVEVVFLALFLFFHHYRDRRPNGRDIFAFAIYITSLGGIYASANFPILREAALVSGVAIFFCLAILLLRGSSSLQVDLNEAGSPPVPNSSSLFIGILAVALAILGWQFKQQLGTLNGHGNELIDSSSYNRDLFRFSQYFGAREHRIHIVANGEQDACVNPLVIESIDRVDQAISALAGISDVKSISRTVKDIYARLAAERGEEGNRALPKTEAALKESLFIVPEEARLFNFDCSLMPIYVSIPSSSEKREALELVTKVSQILEIANKEADPKISLHFRVVGGDLIEGAAVTSGLIAGTGRLLLIALATIFIAALLLEGTVPWAIIYTLLRICAFFSGGVVMAFSVGSLDLGVLFGAGLSSILVSLLLLLVRTRDLQARYLIILSVGGLGVALSEASFQAHFGGALLVTIVAHWVYGDGRRGSLEL